MKIIHMAFASAVAAAALPGIAAAQAPFYERIGPWTVVQASRACTASAYPTAFPDGKMPPWEVVALTMEGPLELGVRFSGQIAADASLGEQEGQALIGDEGQQPEYVRPPLFIADRGGERSVFVTLEGEALKLARRHDFLVVRAGSQMLPVSLTPHRDEVLEALERCSERL